MKKKIALRQSSAYHFSTALEGIAHARGAVLGALV